MIRRSIRLLVAMATALAASTPQAQESGPIKIIVGYAPGGTTDIAARFFAARLTTELGESVIVDNRPGGHTLIANRGLAKALPNGKTFLIGPMSSTLFREVMYPQEKRGYSMLTDYAPVATLVTYPMGLAVSRSTGVSNARELVEWIKKNPAQAFFGSASMGSHTHFLGTIFNQAAGVQMGVVPYKGNGEVVTALLGGQLPIAVMAAPDLNSQKSSTGVRVIGTFTEKRSPIMPDIPTLAEQGIKAFGGEAWIGMWAPARTPQHLITRMQDAVERVLKDPKAVRELQEKFTMVPMFHKGTAMDKLQRDDLEMWRGVIKASGFTPES